MALIFNDSGFLDCNHSVSESFDKDKIEKFNEVISFICAKCRCKTVILIPVPAPAVIVINDVCCSVCKLPIMIRPIEVRCL